MSNSNAYIEMGLLLSYYASKRKVCQFQSHNFPMDLVLGEEIVRSVKIVYCLINHILYWALVLLELNKFNGFVKGILSGLCNMDPNSMPFTQPLNLFCSNRTPVQYIY